MIGVLVQRHIEQYVVVLLICYLGFLYFVSDRELLGELGLQGKVVIARPRRACLLVEFAIEPEMNNWKRVAKFFAVYCIIKTCK